jgi:hypothetical protein
MQGNMRTLALALLIVFVAMPTTSAETIYRETQLTTDASQIWHQMFGGIYWTASFPIDPFTLHDGDTVDVIVHFDRPVTVVGGAFQHDYDHIGANVQDSPSTVQTSQLTTVDFLDVQGSLLIQHLSGTQVSLGNGIGGLFNYLNLTDSSFSFEGLHYSFSDIGTILRSTGPTGLPTVFDQGFITLATQRDGEILFLPEPSTFALLGIGSAAFLAWGWWQRRGK